MHQHQHRQNYDQPTQYDDGGKEPPANFVLINYLLALLSSAQPIVVIHLNCFQLRLKELVGAGVAVVVANFLVPAVHPDHDIRLALFCQPKLEFHVAGKNRVVVEALVTRVVSVSDVPDALPACEVQCALQKTDGRIVC